MRGESGSRLPLFRMNPRFLKQKGSGHIYVWTKILAERPDMEPYEPPAPAPVSAPHVETPTQNSEARPAIPPLDDAIETFRQEARRKTKAGKL